jgi:hypothetical protein
MTVPEQPRGFLECGVGGDFADRVPRNDQLAAFPVDVAQTRGRGNDSFETSHDPTVPPMYDDVNVDYEINMTSDRSWMTADDASRTLQVTRSTLYAYVSRGFVRSESRPGATRERRYSRDDVERLRRRTEGRRDPDKAAAQTLQWGLPILESSITLIAGNTLFYRGHDAVELARARRRLKSGWRRRGAPALAATTSCVPRSSCAPITSSTSRRSRRGASLLLDRIRTPS